MSFARLHDSHNWRNQDNARSLLLCRQSISWWTCNSAYLVTTAGFEVSEYIRCADVLVLMGNMWRYT